MKLVRLLLLQFQFFFFQNLEFWNFLIKRLADAGQKFEGTHWKSYFPISKGKS